MTVVNVTDATLKGQVTGPTFTGNVDGAKFTGSVTYTDTAPPLPLVPVISSTEFAIPPSPPLDTMIGKVIASNSPTSYAITGGNTSNYFAIYSSGNLRTSETIKVPDAVYPLTVTATNSAGTSAPQTITVTIGTGDQVPIPPSTITHGQQIVLGNVGRVGAKSAAISGYSDTMTTVTGTKTYNTNQTVKNVTFTGQVIVTGGNVIFEFCLFKAQPPSASSSSGAALQQYNAGAACGTVTCNWCDFDSGLRGTSGNFETEGFNAGQRAAKLTNQSASKFTLYRCRVQGFGNGVVLTGWQCAMSFITECYIGDCTAGGGSHMDGIEIYASDNVTVQRCRMVGVNNGQCVLANITNDMYSMVNSNPIILQNNMVLPKGDNAPILICRNNANQSFKRNVSVIGNYWGDASNFGFTAQLAGAETPMTGLNVTFDKAYFDANQATNTPGLVYWDKGNVWTPNGEGVTQKTKGAFVDESNFSNGPSGWTGHVLGGTAPPDGNPIPPDTARPGPGNTGYKNAPGYPGSLTNGPSSFQSGRTYSFMSFSGGTFIGSKDNPVNNVKFIGCRFTATGDINVALFGDDITFEYCSIEPSGVSAPPVSYNQGYQYGIEADGSYYTFAKKLTVQNCDIWGFGNGIDVAGSTQDKPQVYRNNWIHDPRADGGIDHTDGLGNMNVANSSYVVIDNNVIEGVGNTNALAFQGGTHSNFTITNNLFGGYGYTLSIYSNVSNITFTDNVFSTRYKCVFGPMREDWPGYSGLVWKRNKWMVPSGAAWGTPSNDGKFWMPVAGDKGSGGDSKFVSTTDYTG